MRERLSPPSSGGSGDGVGIKSQSIPSDVSSRLWLCSGDGGGGKGDGGGGVGEGEGGGGKGGLGGPDRLGHTSSPTIVHLPPSCSHHP